MAGADEPLDEDASMNTQMPFGTQLQHPTRSRRNDDDDVSFVGVTRLEPVLAGNTQRAELKPRSSNATSEAQKQKQLLSLLGRAQPPVAPQARVRDHASTTPQPGRSAEHAATPARRPREIQSKPANEERIEELMARSTQTPPDKGKKRTREVENESPSSHHAAKKTSFSENEPKNSNGSQMDKFAAECPWMKGLRFNRASAIVPDDQAYILQKPESWYKPQVGQRFPGANIPVQTLMVLSRMADEKAALEGADSSGSYHETDPSSGSYPPNSAPQPADEQASESEDEAPTSPVSWNTSPTPEPPQRPPWPHRGLPPDSSIEVPHGVAERAVLQRPAVLRDHSPHPTLPASSHENEVDLPPSSPPAHQAADDSDDGMELETSVPLALGEDLEVQPASRYVPTHIPRTEPRSRSIVQVKETPHVKGKNGQQPVVTISPPTQEPNRQVENSSSASIVRATYQDLSSSAMEETGLDALHKSHNNNQQDGVGADLPTQPNEAQDSISDNGAQDVSMFDLFAHEEPPLDATQQDDIQKQTNNLQTETLQEDAPAQPEPTPISAQLPPKDSSSGEQAAPAPNSSAPAIPVQPERGPPQPPLATPSLTKRKVETITRERRRPSKHKRLKIVSFGGGDTEALRQQRAESLRRFEIERQKSSTSVESRQGSVSNLSVQQDAAPKMDHLVVKEPIKPQVEQANAAMEGNMSPRHRSLYATPSPVLRPAAAPRTAASITESINIDQPEQGTFGKHTIRQAVSEEPVAAQQMQTQPRPKSPPEHQSEPQWAPVPVSAPVPVPSRPSPQVPARAEQAPPSAPVDVPTSLTIFERFKAAYSEYTGTVEHFINQCTRTEELDREDKMIPKWMWDDFIIRNQTDYRDYASKCINSGDEPMPYIRFYKDNIRHVIYKNGIIESRAVLLRALQELGVQPRMIVAPTPQPPVKQAVRQQSLQSPPPPPQQPIQSSPRQSAQRQTQSPMPPPARPITPPPKKKSSRKSLPFTLPSNSMSDRVNGTPRVRHSLPANSSRAAPSSTPAPTPSAPSAPGPRPKRKSNMPELLKQYRASDSPPRLTSDRFREFAKAQQAMTSITGSTRVDSSKPWPRNLEVRPSVRDLPKRQIDILSWKDEL